MTSPYLIADLKRDEGQRLDAYQDTVGVWTIGYGHTGPDVREGLVWTMEQAADALAADVQAVSHELDRELPWWRDLDEVRQDCVANMAFNLGVAGLKGFEAFLGFLQRGLWALAANDLRGTKWARQVPNRAARLILQIRSGKHIA
jgi:lysozyme